MRKASQFSIGLMVLLLLTGCATIKPPFELSNQYFIEKTFDELNLDQFVSGVIPAGSKISFCSLETENPSRIPVAALIEDQMIQSLAKSYRVMERDSRGLSSIIQESESANFKLDQGMSSTEGEVERFMPTSLSSADYIVAYRLQECGVFYDKEPFATTVVRRSIVRMHLRVYNARTSVILMAENRIAQRSDKIPTRLASKLRKLDFDTYYPYAYPVMKPKK